MHTVMHLAWGWVQVMKQGSLWMRKAGACYAVLEQREAGGGDQSKLQTTTPKLVFFLSADCRAEMGATSPEG